MKRGTIFTALILLFFREVAAQEVSTFPTYIDSDLCARLMLGPITPERVHCSQSTYKEGSQPVAVRLRNNMVLSVNDTKMIRTLVGQLAEISGKVKANDGTVKLASARAITDASIPKGDPARKLLDASTYKTDHNAQLFEKIRHELAMMPYITVFDFISFTQNGSDVILTGWTVRATNRDDADRSVKDVDGVTTVVNNIEILPLGSFDMQIRAAARAALQRNLSRYFWGNGSDIKIVVKNGQIILLGTVSRKSDSDIAFIQCNSVPGAFKVFNLLRVQDSTTKEK
jgi:hyperosmotically inducible periplasmic protein